PDRILPAGQSSASWPLAAPYAAPESVLGPASDVWSLAISLYETLTQYLPKADSNGHYVLPQLPAPFADVIRAALVEDPAERISLEALRAAVDPSYIAKERPAAAPTPEDLVDAMAERAALKPETAAEPAPLAAAAQASASGASASRLPQAAPLPPLDPLSVPLSPVLPGAERPKAPSHVLVSSLPNVNVTIAAPRRVSGPRTSGGALKYFMIGAAGTLLLAALMVPRMLRNNTTNPATPPPEAARAASSVAPPRSTAPAKTPPADASPAAGDASPRASSPAPPPKPAASTARPAAVAEAGRPGPVHQVVPEVSAKARSTIRGTVRINVRVQLNPDGSVSSAALDSPATSQFFANTALQAARGWRFAPSGETSALLRFDFTNSGSTAYVVP
ncbi:MAG TPA: TonB family protein, partial [Candidatus Acidoferrum sp.]|nr:TonB family protein [Candidatus Acidoferrum sp.]